MSENTWDYHQPNFYRFNQDSLFLVNFVSAQLLPQQNFSILDVGAGCGVIGLELALAFKQDSMNFFLLELQEEFRPCLAANRNFIHQKVSHHTIDYQIGDLEQQLWGKFDCVVSNPPYFLSGQGQKCASQARQKCRSFENTTPEKFLTHLKSHLKDNGVGYFLGREHVWQPLGLIPVVKKGDVGIYRFFCDSNCK